MNAENFISRMGLARLAPPRDWGLKEAPATIAVDIHDDEVLVWRFQGGDVVQLSAIPAGAAAADMLAHVLRPFAGKHWLIRDRLVLRFPLAMMLTRELKLPPPARRKLADILVHEVERQSPVDSDQVYYDYRVIGIDPERQVMPVEMRIIARSPVDAALALCREAGFQPEAIGAIEDTAPSDGGNFPLNARTLLMARVRRNLVGGLAMLALGLALVLVLVVYLQNQSVIDDMSAQVEQARVQALRVERLQHEIAGARRGLAALAAEKKSLKTLSLLRDVTHVLPDGSFISTFHAQGDEIEITGLSHSAAALIGVFDTAPQFAGAQFRAPLTQGPLPGTERFDLTFHVRKARR